MQGKIADLVFNQTRLEMLNNGNKEAEDKIKPAQENHAQTQKEKRKAYYQTHKEEKKAYDQARYQARKEEKKTHQQAYNKRKREEEVNNNNNQPVQKKVVQEENHRDTFLALKTKFFSHAASLNNQPSNNQESQVSEKMRISFLLNS